MTITTVPRMLLVCVLASLISYGINMDRFAVAGEESTVKIPFGYKLYLYDFFGISATKNGDVCAVGNFGTIFHSKDFGKTWKAQESGVKTELFDVSFVDDKNGWAVGRGGEILATHNGGETWTKQDSAIKDWSMLSVFFLDANRGWVVGEYGTILNTVNGGKTWTIRREPEDVILNRIFFVDADHGWVAGEFGTILHTEDEGNTWVRQQSPFGETTIFGLYFKDRLNGWITCMDGGIGMTEDGGNTWRDLKSPISSTLYSICVIGDTGWSFGEKGSMLKSSDNGKTWEVVPNTWGIFSPFTKSCFVDRRRIWVAGANGALIYTSNGGDEWVKPQSVIIIK